jgi:hypothetical protein
MLHLSQLSAKKQVLYREFVHIGTDVYNSDLSWKICSAMKDIQFMTRNLMLECDKIGYACERI